MGHEGFLEIPCLGAYAPLEEHTGFEPAMPAWKAGVLPLHQCSVYPSVWLNPTGRLSVLSCVADFRIATAFTLQRSRSFPAVIDKEERGGHDGIEPSFPAAFARVGATPRCPISCRWCPSPARPVFPGCQEKRSSLRHLHCRWRSIPDSNRRYLLGKQGCYRYTNAPYIRRHGSSRRAVFPAVS